MLLEKTGKPEFYRTFMEKDFFPEANKVVKYQESNNYWIFKTGKRVFKTKKKAPVQSSASLDEIFCQEADRQLRLYSPQLQPQLFTVKQDPQRFALDWDHQLSSPPLYYGIAMNQLSDRYFLNNLLEKKGAREHHFHEIGHYLHQRHEQAEVPEVKEAISLEAILQKVKDLIYQSKKYLGLTVTKPMLDMAGLPMEKFIADQRKLFVKRFKKGVIREIHGCFIPRKIHLYQQEITALARTSDPIRNRYGDVAQDVADLSVELNHMGNPEFAEFFVTAYCQLSTDKDLRLVLPAYQTIQCLSQGLRYSIVMKRFEGAEAEILQKTASRYYEQAIDVAHQL